MRRAPSTSLDAKGIVAGASVEQATGEDGVRVARVRIRLTQPAATRCGATGTSFTSDVDSAFPVGSVGAASRRRPGSGGGRFATVLESIPADSKPTGASITLIGNGELVAESVTPLADGTPRVVFEFPNLGRRRLPRCSWAAGLCQLSTSTTTARPYRRPGSSSTCSGRRAIG